MRRWPPSSRPSAQTEAEFRRTLFGDLAEAQRKAAGLTEDLVKAEQRTKLQLLTAPVDGVVQQLAVHTVGGVVTPAQQLAVVVPADAASRSKPWSQTATSASCILARRPRSRSIPSTSRATGCCTDRWSAFRMTLSSARCRSKAKTNRLRAEHRSSEPTGMQFLYSARISLDRTRMQVDDEIANLSPGMAVTVEIKTGSRAVISLPAFAAVAVQA